MSEDMNHHVKVYRNVFIGLLFFTILTVTSSYLQFSLVWIGIAVGLTIAFIKGYLVAANFMHLNNEKSFIYGTLFLAVVFFIVLMSIPLSWDMNGFDVKTNRNNAFDEYKIVKDNSPGHGEEDH